MILSMPRLMSRLLIFPSKGTKKEQRVMSFNESSKISLLQKKISLLQTIRLQ